MREATKHGVKCAYTELVCVLEEEKKRTGERVRGSLPACQMLNNKLSSPTQSAMNSLSYLGMVLDTAILICTALECRDDDRVGRQEPRRQAHSRFQLQAPRQMQTRTETHMMKYK